MLHSIYEREYEEGGLDNSDSLLEEYLSGPMNTFRISSLFS